MYAIYQFVCSIYAQKPNAYERAHTSRSPFRPNVKALQGEKDTVLVSKILIESTNSKWVFYVSEESQKLSRRDLCCLLLMYCSHVTILISFLPAAKRHGHAEL